MSRIRHKFMVHPSVIDKFLDVLQDGQSAMLTYSAEEDNYVVELREGTSDETVIQTVGVKFVVNGCVSHSSKWTTLEETYLERIRSLQDKVDAKDEEIRALRRRKRPKVQRSRHSRNNSRAIGPRLPDEEAIAHWQTKLSNTADSLRDACQVVLDFQHSIKSINSLQKTLEEGIKRSCDPCSKWHLHTEPPEPKKLVRLRFGGDSDRDCDGFYDSASGNYYEGKPGFYQHSPVRPTHWSEIDGAENSA